MWVILALIYPVGCLWWLMEGGAGSLAMILVGVVLFVVGGWQMARSWSPADRQAARWYVMHRHHHR